MKVHYVFMAYYAFCCFVCYGIYHIIFDLDRSLWWLLALFILHIQPRYQEKSSANDEDN